MADVTGIGWTNSTHNHWIGCEHASPGCENCYAEIYDRRVGGAPIAERKSIAEQLGIPYVEGEPLLRWGPTAPRTLTKEANRRKPFAWNARAKLMRTTAMLKGEQPPPRHRVFCSSLSDVFDPKVPPCWRLELLDTIRRTPELDWQLLTKRPELVMKLIGAAMCHVRGDNGDWDETICWAGDWLGGVRVPANVWIGATVEDRKRRSRLDELRKIPAVVRFVSAEPLLEDLGELDLRGIDWLITGGESTSRARRFDLAWARALRDQCARSGVAFFFKQLGDVPVVDGERYFAEGKGDDPRAFPPDLKVQQFPIARAA
jgi:protein gp37